MSNANPISAMPFETALNELETIVRKLEQGDIPLDDSIKAYERGVELKKHCQAKLKDAQVKIEQISVDPDGIVKTKPFDSE
jgi:exodeoxyribonuclease VII small subunit